MEFAAAYTQWLKVYPGFHLERVPFSKILIKPGWFMHAGTAVPKPHSSEVPPRLLKHHNGFYTVIDGRRRLYSYFIDLVEHDFNFRTQFWIHQTPPVCLVRDEVSYQSPSGQFVWQIGSSFREIKTPWRTKIWRWVSGKSRFVIITGEMRRVLGMSTQLLLTEIEDVVASLYSDGNVRLYDLQVLAKIEEYSLPGKQQELFLSQQERLKKYQLYLQRLALKDESLGNKTIGLLEKLAQTLELDRAKHQQYEAKFQQLQELLHEMKETLKQELEILKLEKLPSHHSEWEKLIRAEQDFMKKLKYWTHGKHHF